ncbi:MAG: extracellular solute-binding protein [Acidobacteria bacterium]|nr:extracellular solute-binding protein [Acidobacteriota bacterium]
MLHFRFSFAALILVLAGCGKRPVERIVTVYVSVDQVHAEPVLRAFERASGIRAKAVFDVEAAKATGLANRIAAERSRPQADVFWNSEFVQTLRLKQEGLLEPALPASARGLPETARDKDGCWYASGARFRVLIANTKKLAEQERPREWADFLAGRFRGPDLAIALPLFGTSADQAAALYAAWGPERARGLYQKLKDRSVRVVDGNSVVRDLVVQGAAVAGWTDSDDACGAVAEGAAVQVILPGQEGEGTLEIPGTVARVKGGRHVEEARALMDFLLRPESEKMLIDSGFYQASVRSDGAVHPCLGRRQVVRLKAGLEEISKQLEPSRQDMAAIFGRS